MRIFKMKKLIAIAVSAVLLAVACNDKENTVQDVAMSQGKTMGTFYMVQSVSPYEGGSGQLTADCEAEFKRIVDVISTFDPKAELYRLDDLKSIEPVEISPLLFKIISGCQKQSARIDYAMDITVGPLVNLWGFGKDKRLSREPDPIAVETAKRLVGSDKFKLYEENGRHYLEKAYPEVRIDLATVGEGLGADAVADMLDAKGIKNYFASVAGASRSAGVNSRGKPWRIGIEDPSTPDHSIFATVCPMGKAMSTAGSYRNYFKDEKNGRIYSHAIDPKTGRPVDHSTMSVTVIADTAFETDALDTGLLVWGADKALEWAEREGVAVYTIEMKDGKSVGRASSAFKPYLKCGE